MMDLLVMLRALVRQGKHLSSEVAALANKALRAIPVGTAHLLKHEDETVACLSAMIGGRPRLMVVRVEACPEKLRTALVQTVDADPKVRRGGSLRMVLEYRRNVAMLVRGLPQSGVLYIADGVGVLKAPTATGMAVVVISMLVPHDDTASLWTGVEKEPSRLAALKAAGWCTKKDLEEMTGWSASRVRVFCDGLPHTERVVVRDGKLCPGRGLTLISPAAVRTALAKCHDAG